MKIGIIGATGAVGQQMLQCLEERKIQVDELRLFASEKSKGKRIQFNNQEIIIDTIHEGCFKDLDVVLGATSNDLAKEVAPMIVKEGAVFVDNSSAFRMMDDVPLVVPEINGEDIFKHKGIIANPNCSTIISMLAIKAIHQCSPVIAINACTYQAVSGAGIAGMDELNQQIRAINHKQPMEVNVFSKQIAYNCIPQIGECDEYGFTSEEMKMQNEGRKIYHQPNLKVNCTCVRVPVMRSHSIALTCTTEDKLSLEQVTKELQHTEGVQLMELPTPLDASNQDLVFVGRLRKDILSENGISLWCVGDQVRKGAATNAVQIVEMLMKAK